MSFEDDRSAAASVTIINPLEVADWDRQVGISAHADFFHSSAWARVLYETYNYRPMYLVGYGSCGMNAMLPLMEVDSWLSGRRGVSLPFTDAVEPLLQEGHSFQAIFSAARDLAVERGWKYLECRGGKRWLADIPASTSFYRHTLALDSDEEGVFCRFSEPVKRAIRKAERSGLKVEFSQGEDAIRQFYDLLCLTRRKHGVPPQPLAFFLAIQRHVLAAGHGWVVLARRGLIPVAGAVYFHFGKKALYKFGASDENFQELRANNLVMAAAIRRYTGEGFSEFDFGRTSLANQGLRRFKLGWGADEALGDYIRYDLRARNFTIVKDDSSGWHTGIFSRLPLWLSREIGRALYRHIG